VTHTTYTPEEMAAINASGLDFQFGPAVIRNVSKSQLSIARMYGGAHVFSHHYTYNPAADELIRDDVLKWMAKRKREERKARVAEGQEKQQGLF
jgi:hypothetical protein